MKTVTRSELGYDPRRHSKRYETPTSEISAAAVAVAQASMGSEVSGPKIKLRPKPTSDRTALDSSNRRSNLVELEKNNPLHSYRYQRMINSRPKTELREPLQNSKQSSQDQVLTMTRGARKLSTPPPTPPLVDRADEPKSVSSRDG